MESWLEARLSRLTRGKGDHSLRHRLYTFSSFFLFVPSSLFFSLPFFRFLNVRDIKIYDFSKEENAVLKRKVSYSRLRVRYRVCIQRIMKTKKKRCFYFVPWQINYLLLFKEKKEYIWEKRTKGRKIWIKSKFLNWNALIKIFSRISLRKKKKKEYIENFKYRLTFSCVFNFWKRKKNGKQIHSIFHFR